MLVGVCGGKTWRRSAAVVVGRARFIRCGRDSSNEVKGSFGGVTSKERVYFCFGRLV